MWSGPVMVVRHYALSGFYTNLKNLLTSGTPLTTGLRRLSERRRGGSRLRYAKIVDGMELGETLSQALQPFRASLGSQYWGLLHVGEMSGTLEKVLGVITSDLKSRQTTRFVAILPVLICSMVALLAIVLAPMMTLATHHTPGNALAAPLLSTAVEQLAWVVLVVVSVFWLVPTALRAFGLAYTIERILLALPFVGRSMSRRHTSLFCTAMANGLGAGVRMDHILPTALAMSSSAVLQRAAGTFSPQVTVTDQLSQTGLFGDTALDQIQVGETTGKLDDVFAQLATEERALAHTTSRIFIVVLTIGAAFLAMGYVATQIVSGWGSVFETIDRNLEQEGATQRSRGLE